MLTFDRVAELCRAHPNGRDFWYLASPYSKYKEGLDKAFTDAATVAAALLTRGVKVFSPIAHSHPIALFGMLDPHDYQIWVPADLPFLHHAMGLIVACLPGWASSVGVKQEIKFFTEQDLPIVYLDTSGLV